MASMNTWMVAISMGNASVILTNVPKDCLLLSRYGTCLFYGNIREVYRASSKLERNICNLKCIIII